MSSSLEFTLLCCEGKSAEEWIALCRLPHQMTNRSEFDQVAKDACDWADNQCDASRIPDPVSATNPCIFWSYQGPQTVLYFLNIFIAFTLHSFIHSLIIDSACDEPGIVLGVGDTHGKVEPMPLRENHGGDGHVSTCVYPLTHFRAKKQMGQHRVSAQNNAGIVLLWLIGHTDCTLTDSKARTLSVSLSYSTC